VKLLILGGYGNFGARIARALTGRPGIELLIGGRNEAPAQALARALGATALRLDAASDVLASILGDAGVELVIHTAGPFQQLDYHVAEAAAAAGCDYIDLADGRRFVCDFGAALDARFRAAGRVAVSGASSVPGLSSAVLEAFRGHFEVLDSVDICIAPAQRAPRGAATLAGVLSYCGEPVRAWQGGRWVDVVGWAGVAPVAFARMPARRAAWCDVPDLELLPQRYAPLRSVSFRAALELGLAQSTFALLARLRHWRCLPPMVRFARPLQVVSRLFDSLGSETGGMVVRLRGLDRERRRLGLAWHVTAPSNHGPEIPCMAAIALALRLAAGERLEAGARACLGLVRLPEFEAQFARWGMRSELVVEEGGLRGA